MLTLIVKTVSAAALLGAVATAGAQPQPAQAERTAGWKLLSGSDAQTHWRAFKQKGFPAQGWTWADGTFTHAKGGGGGDLITTDQFGDFDLRCQFRTTPKANSGIIWRVAEIGDETWQTGPEYQVLDDTGDGMKPDDVHAVGAMYDLYPPTAGSTKVVKPVGEWNDARIYLRNGVVQHWLNGIKVVEVRIADDSPPAGKPTKEWLDKIASSKFKAYDGFGIQPRGHIGLQDHGDEVAYRNVMVQNLSASMPGEVKLFNGKDLTGWVAIVPDAAKAGIKPEDVWSVQDGVLICKGNPNGYIRTKEDYKNYIIRLEWRFNPVTKKAGNSGVLLRMVGEDKVWPKSVEAQLQSENAGDFWNIDNVKMTADPSRTNGRNTKKTHGAERPIGEWNEYEIIVNHGDVILKVNGEELNRATNVEEVAGKICLQSEGAEIQFRNIRLAPLP